MTQRLPSETGGPTPDVIVRKLKEAITRVRAEMATVELWATALSCFAQPVPSYKPDDKYLLPRAGRPPTHPDADRSWLARSDPRSARPT